MRHFCTYFDKNYLVKALALLDSLAKHCREDYRVHLVCLDEVTRLVLTDLAVPRVQLIALHDLEANDYRLKATKKDRTLVEYYWTLTPTVMLHVLELNPEIDLLTYLDADLFFYSTPDPIFDELGSSSILIHGHRYSPALKNLEANGKYNVGLLCFRRDSNGLAALRWWRDRCIEWCYYRYEDGKMGDQKYLDDWTTRFEGVVELQNPGAGLAPWNHEQYAYETNDNGQITIDGHVLIFYHFHAFSFVNRSIVVPARHVHYPLTKQILISCFVPYCENLISCIDRVSQVMPGFNFGLKEPGLPTPNHTIMAHSSVWTELETMGYGEETIELTADWRTYGSPQMKGTGRAGSALPAAVPEVAVPQLWTPGKAVTNSDELLYALRGLPITREIKTLYIVGVHLFQERDLLFSLFENLEHCYLFEPLPGAAAHLRTLAAQNPKLRVFEYAISDTDGYVNFNVTDNNGESSSLLPMGKHKEVFPWVHEAGTIQVETHTIDGVMKWHSLEEPDMLFLDVQGAEYRILNSLSSFLRQRLKVIYSETSTEEIYAGAQTFDRVQELLKPEFACAGFAPLLKMCDTHGNALFVQRELVTLLEAANASSARRSSGGTDGYVSDENVLARRVQDGAANSAADIKYTVAATMTQQGEAAFSQGNVEEAMALFRRATRECPSYAPAFSNLGVLLFSQNKRPEAVEHFIRALEQDPGFVSALKNLVDAADPVKDYESVNTSCHDYVLIDPDDMEIIGLHNTVKRNYYEHMLSESTILGTDTSPQSCSVSVVVSTYKAEAFMEECLSDLTAQSIADNMEVLVIDADSPQSERVVVEEFMKRFKMIRYIRTPRRIGIYDAWNLGAIAARGAYVAPFSTNDRLDPRAYEMLAGYLDKNPEADIAYGNTHLTDLPHQMMHSYAPCTVIKSEYVWPEIRREWLVWNCAVGPHPMWRRSVHDKVGYFDERFVAIGDQDFFLKVARRSRLGHVDFFTGLQWITQDSLSGRPEAFEEIFKVHYNHFLIQIKDENRDCSPQEASLLARTFVSVLVRYLQLGEKAGALGFYDRYRLFLPEQADMNAVDAKIRQLRGIGV